MRKKDRMIFDPTENPYVRFKEDLDRLEELTKSTDAQVYAFQDEFRKVFLPDQTAFDALKDEAKVSITKKQPVQVQDAIYLKMAMIYKKWMPCRDYLHRMNPSYVYLFKGLEHLLDDIEKKEKDGRKAKVKRVKKSEVTKVERKTHHIQDKSS